MYYVPMYSLNQKVFYKKRNREYVEIRYIRCMQMSGVRMSLGCTVVPVLKDPEFYIYQMTIHNYSDSTSYKIYIKKIKLSSTITKHSSYRTYFRVHLPPVNKKQQQKKTIKRNHILVFTGLTNKIIKNIYNYSNTTLPYKKSNQIIKTPFTGNNEVHGLGILKGNNINI